MIDSSPFGTIGQQVIPSLKRPEEIYMFSNESNTCLVKVKKNSRGLGLAITGGVNDTNESDLNQGHEATSQNISPSSSSAFSKLIRIKRIFESEPASESGLKSGDIILCANNLDMVGLSYLESVNYLHSLPFDVSLKIMRVMSQDCDHQDMDVSLDHGSQSSLKGVNHSKQSVVESPTIHSLNQRMNSQSIMQSDDQYSGERQLKPSTEHSIQATHHPYYHNEDVNHPHHHDELNQCQTPSSGYYDNSVVKTEDEEEEDDDDHESPKDANCDMDPDDHIHANTWFDVTLTKKDGSLGFTIIKKEEGGLYVKDIIKEPAILEPVMSPGDKILLVNGIDVSSLTHAGAISFLRGLPDTVTLRIQPENIPQDILQEVSGLSGGSSSRFNTSSSSGGKRRQLRHEARMMIKEKMQLSGEKNKDPNTSGTSTSSNVDSLSRLKNRNKEKSKAKLNNNNQVIVTPSGGDGSSSFDERRDSSSDHGNNQHQRRRSKEDETGSPSDPASINYHQMTSNHENNNNIKSCKQQPSAHSKSFEFEKQLSTPKSSQNYYGHDQDYLLNRILESSKSDEVLNTINQDLNSSDYSQVNQDNDEDEEEDADNKIASLAKWRGTNLADGSSPENQPFGIAALTGNHLKQLEFVHQQPLINRNHPHRTSDEQDSGFGGDWTPKTTLEKPLDVQKMRTEMMMDDKKTSQEPSTEVMEVTLEKGWCSRLGIILMDDPNDESNPNGCVVREIFPNTVASNDGKIKPGFKLIQVNSIDLKLKNSKVVIDLLRKSKGKIHMKFLINRFTWETCWTQLVTVLMARQLLIHFNSTNTNHIIRA